MEQTMLIKGIALLSALTGLQQWLMHEITMFDIFFMVLVVFFLITLERDYIHYIERTNTKKNNDSPGEQNLDENKNNKTFFLNKETNFLITDSFILTQ